MIRNSRHSKNRAVYILPLMLLVILINSQPAHSQVSVTMPSIEIGDKDVDDADLSTGIQILLLLTALSLAPSFLLLMTSFTRIVIVLSLVRTSLAMHQTPPTQIVIGMALFLTFFVMAPTWQKVNTEAIQPYMAGEINYKVAIDKGAQPIRDFMFRQTREKELELMVGIAKIEPNNESDVPTHVLIPAFIISELKTAFWMGFILFIPFIVIDMVIASILMSMGMMMLPPVMISLPFKILLFVLADGWRLIIKSLLMGFN